MISWHADPWFDHFVRHVALRCRPGAPLSPTLARDRHAALQFAVEARWYARAVHARRPARDRRLIEALADELALPRDTRSLSVVPVFARERTLAPLVTESPPHHHYILLVNAAAEQLTAAQLARETQRLAAELSALGVTSRVTLLARWFRRRLPVKQLRGLLTDALVLAATRARLDDPLVLFADADQLAAAPGQQRRLIAHFARAPRLDFVAAPVWFGLAPDGTPHPAGTARLPELYLGNRLMQAAATARRRGEGVPPHFITQGANVAFRLAALCAGGGLDYRLWEDAQIGWWSAAMRFDGRGRPRYQQRHHRFDERAWVVTDPRRVVRALLAGHSPEHAWTWESHERAPVVPRARTQWSAYQRASALLQLSDVERARDGDASALDKLRRRALFHFFSPLGSRTVGWVTALAARYGLHFDGVAQGALRGVDWGRSPLVDDLVAWATS